MVMPAVLRWTRLSSKKVVLYFSPDEGVSPLQTFASGSVWRPLRPNVRVGVHWGNLVECHCRVVELIQMGVPGLVYVGTGGGFNLEKMGKID